MQIDRLDRICTAKKVTPFSTYAGPDDDEMEELAAELEEGATLEDPWFSCTDGVKTVNAIILALKREKEWSKGFRAPYLRELISTLQLLEKCLAIGKKKRAKFHFLCC